MKNELHNLTEDISRLYEDITQKTESLGQIDSITRLYDELQAQLAEHLCGRNRPIAEPNPIYARTDGWDQQKSSRDQNLESNIQRPQRHE